MTFVILIFAIILGLSALTVLLSYTVAWYELANLQPSLLEKRFAPRNLWLTLRLLVQESLLVFLTVLVYPFGWLLPGEKLQRHSDGPVILLLHGLFHNRACWWLVKHRLRRQGYRNLHTLNLPPWKDLEVLTELIAKKVDTLRHQLGVEQVVLIGHSLGGLLGRNYLVRRGGARKVAGLIQLGTPNQGSKLAPFALTRLAKQLMPNSSFLAGLNVDGLPEGVPVTSIYSRHDNIIIPFHASRLEGARDVELQGCGHVCLLFSPGAFAPLLEAVKGQPPC